MSKSYPYEVYVKGHPFEPMLTCFSNKKAAIKFIKEDHKEPCYVLDTKTGQSIYILYSTHCQFCKKDLAGKKLCNACGSLHMVKGLKHSSYFTMDQVAELIGVNTFNVYDDFYIENNYCQCSEDLQDKDKCECGFEDERNRMYENYKAGVSSIVASLLKEHGLELQDTKKEWIKKLVPILSWKDAADHIRMTINGVGEFEFSSLKEFLDSGPDTPYQAVLTHTHWLKRWYDVYGETNADYKLERYMAR